jgi:uncharacterized membrane protein YfcA
LGGRLDARAMQSSCLVLVVFVMVLTPPAATAVAAGHERTTPIVVRVDEGGFRWTDAAVGAVAGIGATFVTAGGVALLRLRRPAPDKERSSACAHS